VEEAYASRSVFGAPDWEVEGWVTSYTAIRPPASSRLVTDTVRTAHRPSRRCGSPTTSAEAELDRLDAVGTRRRRGRTRRCRAARPPLGVDQQLPARPRPQPSGVSTPGETRPPRVVASTRSAWPSEHLGPSRPARASSARVSGCGRRPTATNVSAGVLLDRHAAALLARVPPERDRPTGATRSSPAAPAGPNAAGSPALASACHGAGPRSRRRSVAARIVVGGAAWRTRSATRAPPSSAARSPRRGHSTLTAKGTRAATAPSTSTIRACLALALPAAVRRG